MQQIKITLTKFGNSNGVFYNLYYLNPADIYPDDRHEIALGVIRTALVLGVVVEVPDTANRIVIVDAGFGEKIGPICVDEGLGFKIINIDQTACI
jgi:hypothetical protein